MKTDLLNTGYFNDNEYLDLYIDLCAKNLKTKKTKGKTAHHHIIPLSIYMAYYKVGSRREAEKLRKKLEQIDYSVNLLHKDHLLAHYYLFCCSKGFYKYKAFSAFKFLIGNLQYNLKIGSTEQLLDLCEFDFTAYQQMYEEGAFLNSQAHIGRKQTRTAEWNLNISKGNTGKKKINNGSIEKAVSQSELVKYLNEGWQLGPLPYTEDRKEKARKSIKKATKASRLKIIGENNPAKRLEVREKISKKVSKPVIVNKTYYNSINEALKSLNWSKKKFYKKVKEGVVQYAKK